MHGFIGFVRPRTGVDKTLPIELTEASADCLSGEMLLQQLGRFVMAHLLRQLKQPVPSMVA